MTTTAEPIVVPALRSPRGGLRDKLQHYLPRLVLAPSFALVLVFVYGFNLWTLLLSFTSSKAFTNLKFIGFANYQKLWTWTFQTDPPSSWYTAIVHMGLFGGLYVVFCLVLGLGLAILLDERSAAKEFCGRSISIRWRSRSSSPGPPGNCSSTRVSDSRRPFMTWAGRASISTGSSIRA